jgi:integrase
MDDLTYELRQLCRRNRDNSHETQAGRLNGLTLIARQLRELGFRQMHASSLKPKHVEALVNRWQAEGLAAGTQKNRMSYIRWWAEKVNKAGIIPADNAELAIPDRVYVTNENKARSLDDRLSRITDVHVLMSLRMQELFGLRREESIKFRPSYADRGDHLALKGSWCKGSRPRIVPITTPEQRALLNQVHKLAGTGSLIPAHKSYIEQRNVYDGQCKAAGMHRMHGLRHQYAQARYEALTGWKAPAAGGPSTKMLTPEQRVQDVHARQIISYELGHERLQVTAIYLGR